VVRLPGIPGRRPDRPPHRRPRLAGRPAVLVEATAERVRQVAFADASYGGNVSSDPAYGTPTSSMRWPDTLYKFLEAEGRRFAGCWL
jgi:hypothetical protein